MEFRAHLNGEGKPNVTPNLPKAMPFGPNNFPPAPHAARIGGGQGPKEGGVRGSLEGFLSPRKKINTAIGIWKSVHRKENQIRTKSVVQFYYYCLFLLFCITRY
jgi:hypothetical protein